MAHLLGNSKAVIPSLALIAGMLTLGVIPAQGVSVGANSADVHVAVYESSASGGVLHS